MFDVIIIGGGLSGLSSAVELSALGNRVLLLEQRRSCGGRTYSFIDKETGDSVDNGQHLMMGCYHATRRYLHLVGTDHLVSLQPTFKIDFIHPSENVSSLACLRLPAPLHMLGGLLNFNVIPLKDRLKMFKVIMELFRTSSSKEKELDRLTADEWLNRLGQSEISRKYFWDIITFGALNNHPTKVSALMLYRVLRAAFLGHSENSSFLIPQVGLNELFVEPAVQFITAHGNEVQNGVGIESMIVEGTRVRSVRTNDGNELFAKSFISAVPWYVARTMLPHQDNNFDRFYSSPIISIQLWFDRKVTDLEFAALPEMRIQWIFNKTKLLRAVNAKNNVVERQYLSLVISGAQEYIELGEKQLVNIALQDIQCVMPQARDAKVIHSLVIKEKRATFLPSPGLEAFRPNTQTEFENFFLAGDWTATGYPATIEGAIMSGRKAAESVHSRN